MNALFMQFLKEMQNKGRLKFYENHSLSLVSTFGIGGRARVFVVPFDTEALCLVINLARKNGRYLVIGNASNLLFDDRGYAGTVISTVKIREISVKSHPITVTDSRVFEKINAKALLYASCGCMLPLLSATALNHGFTGFEGLCSIPATVGGAVRSNAGAFGTEISDTLVACEMFYPSNGKIELVFPDRSAFSYRKSTVCSGGGIVLSAYFVAKEGEKENIKSRMDRVKTLRASSQPIAVKSAGSYFKRPDERCGKMQYRGKSAGELIDRCGLKGLSVGGASVSSKHANFIVNESGNASANNVLALAKKIKSRVFAITGIRLSEEVEYVTCFMRKHP